MTISHRVEICQIGDVAVRWIWPAAGGNAKHHNGSITVTPSHRSGCLEMKKQWNKYHRSQLHRLLVTLFTVISPILQFHKKFQKLLVHFSFFIFLFTVLCQKRTSKRREWEKWKRKRGRKTNFELFFCSSIFMGISWKFSLLNYEWMGLYVNCECSQVWFLCQCNP